MIKIVRGVYGFMDGNGIVHPKTADDEPFEITEAQEERLVNMGVAVYVNGGRTALPEGVEEVDYNINMKASELREIARDMGLTFPVGTTKKEMIEAMDKFISELPDDGAEVGGAPIGFDDVPPEDVEDDDAPTFDASEAVL